MLYKFLKANNEIFELVFMIVTYITVISIIIVGVVLVVKVLDCGIVVSEFELQSHYYVHFRTNTLGKGMTPPYSPNYGLNNTTAVVEGWLWH